LFAARQVVGDVDYNVVKIRTDGRSVSFLKYDQFEADPHPALDHSVRVYLPKAEYAIRDYSESVNPPILHRKETMVDPLHQSYTVFAALTKQEEQPGLLSRSDIGTRQGWLAALTESGVGIEGHTIQALNANTSQM
jgi:DNA phosphorothioation-associated putative methyltransferase